MSNKDLANLLEAIKHLSQGIEELGKNLPPAPAQRLARAQQGVKAALLAIIDRHDPKSVEFSQRDDDGVTFTMDLPPDEWAGFGGGSTGPSVSLTNPFPPPPPKPPQTK